MIDDESTLYLTLSELVEAEDEIGRTSVTRARETSDESGTFEPLPQS
jgi:hypothetical protein